MLSTEWHRMLSVLVVLCSATLACAQPAWPTEEDARRIADRGLELLDGGNAPLAVAELERFGSGLTELLRQTEHPRWAATWSMFSDSLAIIGIHPLGDPWEMRERLRLFSAKHAGPAADLARSQVFQAMTSLGNAVSTSNAAVQQSMLDWMSEHIRIWAPNESELAREAVADLRSIIAPPGPADRLQLITRLKPRWVSRWVLAYGADLEIDRAMILVRLESATSARESLQRFRDTMLSSNRSTLAPWLDDLVRALIARLAHGDPADFRTAAAEAREAIKQEQGPGGDLM